MKHWLLALLFVALPAHADIFAVAVHENLRVTLTDEPCALTDQVTNLPKRVIWEDGKQKIEGCFGVIGPVVVAYFADKTVVAVPVEAFVRASGI